MDLTIHSSRYRTVYKQITTMIRQSFDKRDSNPHIELRSDNGCNDCTSIPVNHRAIACTYSIESSLILRGLRHTVWILIENARVFLSSFAWLEIQTVRWKRLTFYDWKRWEEKWVLSAQESAPAVFLTPTTTTTARLSQEWIISLSTNFKLSSMRESTQLQRSARIKVIIIMIYAISHKKGR